MNGENLQSKVGSILKENGIDIGADKKTLDILHNQTEAGVSKRNPQINTNTLDKKLIDSSEIVQKTIPDKPSTVIGEDFNRVNINRNAVNQGNDESRVVPIQKTIRTYEGDIAELMSKKKTSVAKMVIAEADKNREDQSLAETSKSSQNLTKNILVLLLSISFIVGGVFATKYLYQKSPLAKQPVAMPIYKIPSIINPDIQKTDVVKGLTKEAFTEFMATEINKYEIEDGKILEVVPVASINPEQSKVSSQEFITALGFDITNTLKRSLTKDWMFGIYSNSNRKVPFIILKNDFFQNAYAGMLAWESSLIDDFAKIFNYYEKTPKGSMGATYYSLDTKFTDKTVKNRDIREYRNSGGETLILYSFIDKNTIVITTDDSIIPAILDRIEKQTYVR